MFARWQTAALKAHRKPLLWPWPWVPVREVALALGCLLGTVFGGFGRFWRVLKFWQFGAFAGWQTAALKANRKPLLWLGPGVPDSEVALALGCLLGKVFGGFWRVWRVLKGVEGLEGFGGFGGFGGLEGFGGFGRFGGFWRVFGGFGRLWPFWRVWRVLEGVWRVWRILERLEGFGWFWRVWSVCGLANGSFESQ